MTLTFPEALQRLAPVGGRLAGRSAELDILRSAWSRAADGHGGMVLIGGEAGVGKTRLAAELAYEVEAAGASVLVGRCPAGGADPYHPLVEALGPVAPPAGSLDRDALFAVMADGLARRSRRGPVLLLLDDLHRADRSTVLAVRRIAEAAAGAAVLVVGTYRDPAVDRSSPLVELLDQPGVDRVTLEGLAAADFGEIYGDADLGRRLWRRSGGNPVVVDELLRLRALGDAPTTGFDALVARRLAGLEPSTRRVLEAAAVAGTEFSVPAVAAAAQLSADRTAAALERAAAAGFVAAAAEPGTRRFVHDMVREAVERGVDPSRRVRLHRRVARAREADASPAWLAWHFRAAAPVGGSVAALRQSSRAGDRAMDLLAWEEAAAHYGHALAAGRGATPATRADLLLSLGEAQRLAGEAARARQAFLEAAAVARRMQDGPRLARAALALGQVAAVWGADPVLESLAGEARILLGHGPAVRRPAPVDFASGDLYDVLDGVVAEPDPVQPVRPAVAAGSDDGGAAALLRARHAALAGPEHAAERLAAAADMVALAVETGDEQLEIAGRGRRVVDLMALGRLDEVAVEQSVHAALADRLGGPAHGRDVAAWSAMRALVEGRPGDARAAAEVALARGTEAGDPEAPAGFLLHRWELALAWGTADELVVVADECDDVARDGGAPQVWRAMAALALARAGQDELAAEELRRVAGRGLGPLTRDPARLLPLTCLAEVAWLLGDASRAAILGPLLEPFADRSVVGGRGLVWRGPVARACGLVAATTGRWEDADRHLQAALAVCGRAGALPLLARTRAEESEILLRRGRRGDKRRAAEAWRESTQLAARVGMTRPAREAR